MAKDKEEGFMYVSSDALIANAIEASKRAAKRADRKDALRNLSDKSKEERRLGAQYVAASAIVGAGETIGLLDPKHMSPALAARHLAEIARFAGFEVVPATHEARLRMVQAAELRGQAPAQPDTIAPGHPSECSPLAVLAREGRNIAARENLASEFGPSWYEVIEAVKGR
jgi:hypothetical protein